jgi:hypothetical protein
VTFSVDIAACPPWIFKSDPFGVNEHTGEIATNGLIEPQARVIPSLAPGPVVYPLLGFMLTTPSAPLPAGTLVGATALWTVIVNCGVTASTVKSSAGLV